MQARSEEELARMREIDEHLPHDLGSLVGKLSDPDHMVRHQAATRLGGMEDPVAIPPLMTALEDEHQGVRASAALALGRLHADAALPAILTHALTDPAPQVRMISIWAAGMIDSEGMLDELGPELNDPDEHVRSSACNEYVCHGDCRAEPQIRELLTHEDHLIRCMAAGMLIRLGLADDQVFHVLEHDESWTVRQNVAEELVRHKIGDARMVAAIERLITEPEAAEYQAKIVEMQEYMASVQRDDEPDEELTQEEQAELRELDDMMPRPLAELLEEARAIEATAALPGI